MSLESVINEMFDLVRCRKLTREELVDHIKRTYEISSDRIVDMILDWCEVKIKQITENLWLIAN